MRTLLLAGGLALALGSAAAGQETASTPPGMSGACLAALVPAGAACQVVGTATLAATSGAPASWTLYELNSAEGRSGLSVMWSGDAVAASLPITAEDVDRWKREPFVIASIIKRDEGEYAVMMVPGDERPAAFSVHRIGPDGWTPVDTNSLWPQVEARLTAVSGAQCYPITTDINWRSFSLRYGMMSDAGSCGSAILGLGIENGAAVITDAMAVKPDLTPLPHRRRRQ